MTIEMLYHLTLDSANGTVMKLFGSQVDTAGVTVWAIAIALLVAGIVAFRAVQGGFAQVWGEATSEIEEAARRAEA